MLCMPKIIGGSLHQHREQTRDRIFDALAELLESEDFSDLTFSMIAKAAGVGRTAMYNHFPDKDALLIEFAMHETRDYLTHLREGIAGATSTTEAIELYVRTQLNLSKSFHMPQGSMRGGVHPSSLTPETGQRMREHVVMIEDVLRDILTAGVARGELSADLDVDQSVRIVNSLLIGRSVTSEAESQALLAFVARGLGATAPVAA